MTGYFHPPSRWRCCQCHLLPITQGLQWISSCSRFIQHSHATCVLGVNSAVGHPDAWRSPRSPSRCQSIKRRHTFTPHHNWCAQHRWIFERCAVEYLKFTKIWLCLSNHFTGLLTLLIYLTWSVYLHGKNALSYNCVWGSEKTHSLSLLLSWLVTRKIHETKNKMNRKDGTTNQYWLKIDENLLPLQTRSNHIMIPLLFNK